ncbi:kinase-like domain-containing protein [Suillus tomentosus]|nr:kinase-like domain-containing protein [Suillus tomentosus]
MGCCASFFRKPQGQNQTVENHGNDNSVDTAFADPAIRPSMIPVVPVSALSDITTPQPNGPIQLSAPQAQVQVNLSIPSNIVNGNLASGAVIMLQPITSGAHEARPVAFDTDPTAIPPTSIRKQSEYPTSSGGLGDIWRCSRMIDSTSTEVHMMSPSGCESRRLISVGQVAVKAIRITDVRNKEAVQKAKKRLRREVAVWARLRHAHVLTLHGTVSGFGQLPALVSEWMHNGALDGYLERTSLTMGQKLKLLKQVVDGLRYLHEQKVIHGDLTSTNVVIDHDGNAFLADFGLSVALAEADRSYYNSHSSGAVRWIAPELLGSSEPQNTPDGSDSDVDLPKPNSQSDVFSLGCIMLHVFSGRLPFWWLKKVQHIFSAQLNRTEPYRLESSVTVSQQHLDFMRRCWSAEPQVRPSTGDAASFVEEELASVPSH